MDYYASMFTSLFYTVVNWTRSSSRELFKEHRPLDTTLVDKVICFSDKTRSERISRMRQSHNPDPHSFLQVLTQGIEVVVVSLQLLPIQLPARSRLEDMRHTIQHRLAHTLERYDIVG